MQGVKIFRFDGALHFASFDYFVSKIIAKTGLNAHHIVRRAMKKSKTGSPTSSAASIDLHGPASNALDSSQNVKEIPTVVSTISKATDDAAPISQFPGAISLDSVDGESSAITHLTGANSFSSNENTVIYMELENIGCLFVSQSFLFESDSLKQCICKRNDIFVARKWQKGFLCRISKYFFEDTCVSSQFIAPFFGELRRDSYF